MSKIKILIGSVLKPINDARMYEKIGISLSNIPETEVQIAGFKAEAPLNSKIIFHPVYSFNRLNATRLWAAWKFLRLLLKIKPTYTLVCTWELLLPACLYKIISGNKLIYDVQENYFRNINDTNTFPPVLKNILACFVRGTEYLTRPFVNYYLLAEENYEMEFSFTKGKSIVLENKSRRSVIQTRSHPVNLKNKEEINFLYSGTIAEGYGIFEGIELVKKLQQIFPKVSLTIIGYAQKKETLEKVKEKIKDFAFIRLTGGEKLVPYSNILEEIKKSDITLVPYRPNRSTENCMPTKIFEYMAHQLPMIIQENSYWKKRCQPYDSAIFIDYQKPDPEEVINSLFNSNFYSNQIDDSWYWESQESKLASLFN